MDRMGIPKPIVTRLTLTKRALEMAITLMIGIDPTMVARQPMMIGVLRVFLSPVTHLYLADRTYLLLASN